MPEDAYSDGTVTSGLKPIVTMLTDALESEFVPLYHRTESGALSHADELGHEVEVTEERFRANVNAWLMSFEDRAENDDETVFAKMIVRMLRSNQGWMMILGSRALKKVK